MLRYLEFPLRLRIIPSTFAADTNHVTLDWQPNPTQTVYVILTMPTRTSRRGDLPRVKCQLPIASPSGEQGELAWHKFSCHSSTETRHIHHDLVFILPHSSTSSTALLLFILNAFDIVLRYAFFVDEPVEYVVADVSLDNDLFASAGILCDA